nr:unnamed protein product [Callosobruchus analis]
MNDQILGLLDGDYTTYLCDDSVETEDDGERLNFTIEFLNSINPSGMPEHRLRLKVGTVLMLLRNLNTKKGLCNGNKLVMSSMRICDGHICRKAAAKTLYQIDFDVDVCKYPYTYFCGGGKIEKWDFLSTIFKDLTSFIKRVDVQSLTHYQVFAKSFHMCNQFSPSSNLEQIYKDDARLPKDYKELVVEMLLTQSMPFFDIDVYPVGNVFQIQISPPGLNIWQSPTFKWSFLNHVKSSCLEKASQTLNPAVDMKLISEDIKTCCKEKLMSYIKKYTEDSVDNKTHITKPKIMERYSQWIKEYFFETYENPESNYVNITMEQFCYSQDYYLGLKWRDLFLTIGVSYNATSVLRSYRNKIQLLINANNPRYCLELVSQLMPDVASVMVQEAVDDSMYNDSLSTVKTLFGDLKQTFIKSLPSMFKQKKDLKVFENELSKVSLMSPRKLRLIDTYNMKRENMLYGNIMALVNRRRKSVFRLLKEKVDVEYLLKYYVSPFDSGLHTFLPFETIVFQPGFLLRAFEMEFLPREVYLSKIGFILAYELIKFSTERGKSTINDVYGYGYLIEGDEYMFSSWVLPENQIKSDRMAFALIVRHLFEDSREIEKMCWLNGTLSNSQAFVTTTIQEFCDWSIPGDVINDLYNNLLPASFRIRSLMLSSKFALESFNCQ